MWTTTYRWKPYLAKKPYLPEKKTVVVFKTLVLERAWVPGLVHPRVIKSCPFGHASTSLFIYTAAM